MEAHFNMPSMGFAPALKGFERVAGGWYMIVMDAITDKSVTSTNKCLAIRANQGESSRSSSTGYVHGDLRDTKFNG